MNIPDVSETHDRHLLNLCPLCEKKTPLDLKTGHCFRCEGYFNVECYLPKPKDDTAAA